MPPAGAAGTRPTAGRPAGRQPDARGLRQPAPPYPRPGERAGRMEAGGAKLGTRPTRAGSFCRNAAGSRRRAAQPSAAVSVTVVTAVPTVSPSDRPGNELTAGSREVAPAIVASSRATVARQVRLRATPDFVFGIPIGGGESGGRETLRLHDSRCCAGLDCGSRQYASADREHVHAQATGAPAHRRTDGDVHVPAQSGQPGQQTVHGETGQPAMQQV